MDASPTFVWFSGPLQPIYSWTVTVQRFILPEVVTYTGVSGIILFSSSLAVLASSMPCSSVTWIFCYLIHQLGSVNVTLTVTDGSGINTSVVTRIVTVAPGINLSPQIFGMLIFACERHHRY